MQQFFSSLQQEQSTPSAQEVLLTAAKTAEKQDDFKQAAFLYQQYLDKQPGDKEIQLALADSYRRSGDLDAAIIEYDTVLAQDAGSVPAKEGKALALITRGDFDTPAMLLDEVMKVEPTRWKTLNALGILFATRNLYNEAGQYFQEALKFSPSNPTVTNNLGLTQALQHNTVAAIQNLIMASSLLSSAGSAQRQRIELNLALVYAVNNHLDEARAIAQKYYTGTDLDNTAWLYGRLAKDESLGKIYLSLALTESKAFYEKALISQTISNGSINAGQNANISTPVGSLPSTASPAPTPVQAKRPLPAAQPPAVAMSPNPVTAAPSADASAAPIAKKPAAEAPAAKPKKTKEDDGLSAIINKDLD